MSPSLALGVALSFGCAPTEVPPTPEQPIAFSHAAHVEAEITCERCHTGATEAKRAGMPGVFTCASCHRRVIPDHPEVVKLMAAQQEGEPILWRRVNHIEDRALVHFNHGAHARAGVECSVCHGDVASMTVAEPLLQVSNMGWCVDCHRENEASDDCLECHY